MLVLYLYTNSRLLVHLYLRSLDRVIKPSYCFSNCLKKIITHFFNIVLTIFYFKIKCGGMYVDGDDDSVQIKIVFYNQKNIDARCHTPQVMN